eukprot:4116847-Prorocentrum_lima.AAC.1
MTSSLVGSEMCIRDRFLSRSYPGPVSYATPVLLQLLGPPASGMPFLGPVSYTHLTLPTICSV